MDFPGENFTYCCLKIRYYCERLDNSGYWDEQLLVKLVNIFKSGTEYKLGLWYITSSTKKMKYIEKCTFQNMPSIPEEQRVDYDSMLNGSTTEYELVFKNKECTLPLKLKTHQEDATIPSGYQAQINSLVYKRLNDRLSHSGGM